jgi:hypothetical protein
MGVVHSGLPQWYLGATFRSVPVGSHLNGALQNGVGVQELRYSLAGSELVQSSSPWFTFRSGAATIWALTFTGSGV